MHDTELELLARQLAEGLRGDHDVFCRELVRLLACGYPVTRERLATVLQMTVEQVGEVLAGLADLEVDQSGNVVATTRFKEKEKENVERTRLSRPSPFVQ